MSLSCGQDKPLNILKNAFFSCLIGIYFSPFFFEHPVFLQHAQLLKSPLPYNQKGLITVTFLMNNGQDCIFDFLTADMPF